MELSGVGIRVVLLDAETGATVGEILDTATLAPGGSFSGSGSFSTEGLTPKSYLAVGAELTLDDALLAVVNVPPDCSGALVKLVRRPGASSHRCVE